MIIKCAYKRRYLHYYHVNQIYNMVEQIPKYKKNLSSLISFCILLSYISLNPRLAYAENAEATTDIVQEPANITESKPNSSNTNNNIEEALSTEAIWFGLKEEVTIATRHETPVSKAPSIVTVITAEEIKNLGYRTFAEILRIIPEVIRGPGSAMYGEDASTAVINIITKGTKDIDGMSVSSGYGSFDTYEENAVFGKRCGEVEISGMVH